MVTIQGRRMYLWRAVDSEGEVLDLLVQPKRDTAAALRLMRKLLKKQGYTPDELVTDKLAPTAQPDASCIYRAAMSRAYARTTGRKTRISQFDGESESSNGSSPLDQPSAFSRCTLRFTTRSTFNATSSPAAPFGPSGPRRPLHGRWPRLRPNRTRCSDLCDLAPIPVTKPSQA